MSIYFKLYEFISSFFSKSQQLKNMHIKSLTKGIDFQINIFDSISKNLSHSINCNNVPKSILIGLIKSKILIGTAELHLINQKQKINITPLKTEKHKLLDISIILLCCYKKQSRNIKECKTPNKLVNKSNLNTICISSIITPYNKDSTPFNQSKNKSKFNDSKLIQTNYQKYKNKIENSKLNFKYLRNNRNYVNLSQEIGKYNGDDVDYSCASKTNQSIKGLISNYGNCLNNSFYEKNEKNRIYSPNNYSTSMTSKTLKNGEIKRKNKVKSRTQRSLNKNQLPSQFLNSIAKYSETKKENLLLGKETNSKNNYNNNVIDINKKIEDYIIDKNFENFLKNDMQIISEEERNILFNYKDINLYNFNTIINDFDLLYSEENIKNMKENLNLECFYLIEKIYDLMKEYYLKYNEIKNQNFLLVNSIKNFNEQTNFLLKMQNKLKLITQKINIKQNLNVIYDQNKVNLNIKCKNDLSKINHELNILNEINKKIIINNEQALILKKNKLKEILTHTFTKINLTKFVDKNQKSFMNKMLLNVKKNEKNNNDKKISVPIKNKKYSKNRKNSVGESYVNCFGMNLKDNTNSTSRNNINRNEKFSPIKISIKKEYRKKHNSIVTSQKNNNFLNTSRTGMTLKIQNEQ